ncbi:lactate utilization protein C [Photobacterium sp. SDRW27]|uniref:LutC/YkgG family protein n=1 Tax=Photobacterium obscurum TaxID=2829490 RepID=UPI002244B7AA|nr:lactate utilization protein C [Photobacterium obscurum]MCW8329729.1 lactate utilization protein C [Photobacterium obscurum]
MSKARQTILSRLREVDAPLRHSDTSAYQPWTATSETELQQRFVDGLTASHAEVFSTTAEQLESVLSQLLADKQLSHIAIGTGGEFLPAIEQATQQAQPVVFERDIKRLKTKLFEQVDAGITHCLAGIADTGTLVLWPDSQEPRTLSLVPPTHIAIIKRSTLANNFTELMHEQAWHTGMPTNSVLISGPSKTADIQQTLAYGAHGPRELVVVLIEDK